MRANIDAVMSLFPAKVKFAGTGSKDSAVLPVQSRAPLTALAAAVFHRAAVRDGRLARGEFGPTGNHISDAILEPHSDHSLADFEFARILCEEALRLGVQDDQIAHIVESAFYQSGLADRDKWQSRSEYREITVQAALDAVRSKKVEPVHTTISEAGSILGEGGISISLVAPPPRDWVVENWLHAGKAAVLGGMGGVSKTQFAIQMGQAIARGIDFMGCKTRRGTALLILGEEDNDEISRRISAYVRHQGLSSSEINDIQHRVRGYGLVGEDIRLNSKVAGAIRETNFIESLLAKCGELGDVVLIVVDHVGLIHGGDFNAREDAAFTMRQLNHVALESGASVLLLAHSPKSAAADDQSMAAQVAGSTAFVDQARAAIIMATMRENEAKDFRVPAEARQKYVSAALVKNNYGPTGEVRWFERQSQDGVGLLIETSLAKPIPKTKRQLSDSIKDYVRVHAGKFSKTKLRGRVSGKDGPLKASKGAVEAAIEELLESGELINRPPTEAEVEKWGHGHQVKYVLDITANVGPSQ